MERSTCRKIVEQKSCVLWEWHAKKFLFRSLPESWKNASCLSFATHGPFRSVKRSHVTQTSLSVLRWSAKISITSSMSALFDSDEVLKRWEEQRKVFFEDTQRIPNTNLYMSHNCVYNQSNIKYSEKFIPTHDRVCFTIDDLQWHI